MMVMMNECGVTMEDVCKEMDIRAQKNRQPEEIPRFRPQYLIFIPKIIYRCYFVLIARQRMK